MNEISIKSTYIKNEYLVAACDSNLLGKIFRENKFRLNISENFYGGEKVNCDEFIKKLKKATIANLCGETTIKCAVKHNFLDNEGILVVEGIPHAQIFVVK